MYISSFSAAEDLTSTSFVLPEHTTVSNQQSTNENSTVEIKRRARRGVPVKQININESLGERQLQGRFQLPEVIPTLSSQSLPPCCRRLDSQLCSVFSPLAQYSCPWPLDLSHHIPDAYPTDLN